MEVFIVTMYHFGEREAHSYVLGCWSTYDLANENGQLEKDYRGCKYYPEIVKYVLDTPNSLELEDSPIVVYPLKSAFND